MTIFSTTCKWDAFKFVFNFLNYFQKFEIFRFVVKKNYFTLDGSSTPDDLQKFFDELGSGSFDQVSPGVDDDQEFENKEAVSIIVN